MTRLLGVTLMVVLALTACSSEEGSQAQDSGEEQETETPTKEEPAPPPEELIPATGVLERPEIPLHTNASENDLRACVTKRRISGGTMSAGGRQARDVMLGLMKTCQKLGSLGKRMHH